MRRSLPLLMIGFVLVLAAGIGAVGNALTAEAAPPDTARAVPDSAPPVLPPVVADLVAMAMGQGAAAPSVEGGDPADLAPEAQGVVADAVAVAEPVAQGSEPEAVPVVAPGLGRASGFTCGFVSGARRCRSSN